MLHASIIDELRTQIAQCYQIILCSITYLFNNSQTDPRYYASLHVKLVCCMVSSDKYLDLADNPAIYGMEGILNMSST